MAEAMYRRWPGNLVVTALDGYRVNPISAGVLRRVAERQLADATSSPAADLARARMELIDREIAEFIYDLECLRGHSTLRTTPEVRRAMVRSHGKWADLG